MAGEGDAERLVVMLEARVRQFEKDMERAEKKATGSYGKMRRGSYSATRNMEKDMTRSTGRINQALSVTGNKIGVFAKSSFGGLAAAGVAAVASIASVTVAIKGAKDAISEFDRIGKNAKAGGLDAEAYQEFAYAAELGGVETGQFAKAMETLARNTGLAAAGKGRLITQLKVLNPELLKNLNLAISQEERIRLIADALDKEADASRKAAIANALFGESGAKMVEVLKGGSAALDDTARKARNLGIVVDNELIAKSETLNDELTTATKVMDMQFKQALVELAPILTSTAELAADVASAINSIVQSMRSLEDRTQDVLEQDYTDVVNALEGNGLDPRSRRSLEKRKGEIEAQLRARAIQRLRDGLTKPAGNGNDDGLGGGGTRKGTASAALKQAETVQTLITNLEHERAQLGRNSQEQELYNALKQAGVERNSEYGQAIETNLTALQRQRDYLEQVAEAQELVTGGVLDFVDALGDGLARGEDFWTSFRNAATGAITDIMREIARTQITSAISNIFGMFSSNAMIPGVPFNLIPGRASGGPVEAGRPYIVGEKRPELFVPETSGRILPYVPSGGSSNDNTSANADISVTINVAKIVANSEAEGAAAARGLTREARREVASMIPAGIESYNRNPLRRSG